MPELTSRARARTVSGRGQLRPPGLEFDAQRNPMPVQDRG